MTNGFARWCGMLGVLLVMPVPVAAQGPAEETLVAGRRSIQIGIFDGASLGFWKMRNANTNLGIIIDGDVDFSSREHDATDASGSLFRVSIGAGPEVRRYSSISDRVAPYGFLGGALRASYYRSDDDETTRTLWDVSLSGRAGIGAEFFPAASLSIGGQMGLGAAVSLDPASDDDSSSGFDIGLETFGASLMAAIYF